ncbi:MAG: glycosyltransferase [Anaerolineales bacterium]|nr:glycosyltransferase [Anaerolineales bacterium]
MISRPLISLSVISHGNAAQLSRLLASLQQHEKDTKRFQLIVTDNLKDDLPDLDPSPWESLHLLRNPRQMGFAQNHNQAFERAQGKYYAILNPDLMFERPVFDGLITRIHSRQADLIAPVIVDESGAPQDSFRALPAPFEIIRRRLPGYQFKPPQPDGDQMIRPDWMAGMFWLMESDIYRQLGGMDERYRLYFEDVEFCTRARLRGLKLLVDAQFQVRHDAQRSSRTNPYYLFLHIQSALRFFTSPTYRRIKQR